MLLDIIVNSCGRGGVSIQAKACEGQDKTCILDFILELGDTVHMRQFLQHDAAMRRQTVEYRNAKREDAWKESRRRRGLQHTSLTQPPLRLWPEPQQHWALVPIYGKHSLVSPSSPLAQALPRADSTIATSCPTTTAFCRSLFVAACHHG